MHSIRVSRVLPVIIVAVVWWSPEAAMAESEQRLLPFAEADVQRLDAQRAIVEQYLADEPSRQKYQTPAGRLGPLRALLQAKAFRPDQTYELQAMGVVLGDVFVQDLGFHWIIVKDEHGRDPAIQYKDTSIILYPLTMISKRIERGEEVDVFDLYNGLATEVQKLIDRGY